VTKLSGLLVCCPGFTAVLQAVMDDWYFQMYYDDLPVWGFIGKVRSSTGSGSSSRFVAAVTAAAADVL
jgi:hypothetical protein